MKLSLTTKQKVVLILFFFIAALIGFMVKLPSGFRHMDKELHAVFYFLAAAFLNLLFNRASVIRHVIIFAGLYLFGVFIEYAQGYSNHFFHKRIHGRYDPEDIASNVQGLVVFSIVWCVWTAGYLVYKKTIKVSR